MKRLFTMGKFGGGGGDVEDPPPQMQTIYYETGMHILAMGQGQAIRAVYQQGKDIGGACNSSTTPSGATVSCGTEGSFRVYWGTDVQPVDPSLRANTGLKSYFPHIFYIVWNPKRLGTQALWPQLEYDIEVTHPADLVLPTDGGYLKGSDGDFSLPGVIANPSTVSTAGLTSRFGTDTTTSFILDTTNGNGARARLGDKFKIPSLNYSAEVVNVFVNASDTRYLVYLSKTLPSAHYGSSVTATVVGTEYSGVNPISALYQMLFAEFPHGLGWATTDFVLSDFNELASFFKNTERSPCTILLRSGKSFKDGVSYLMQDFGLQFSFDYTLGKYRILKIRTGGTLKTIALDEYKAEEAVSEFAYAVMASSRTVYSFKDSSRKFADSTLIISDDGCAKFSEDPNTTKVDLSTITDLKTANQVASRREQEGSLNSALTLKVSFRRLDIYPGNKVQIEGFSGTYIALETDYSPDGPVITMAFAKDTYSVDNDYEEEPSAWRPTSSRVDPSTDMQVSLLETNRMLAKDSNACHVLRIRRSGYISGSSMYASGPDSTFKYEKQLSYCAGGVLVDDLPETSGVLMEDGPEITVYGPDITDVVDLTGSEALWRSGEQFAVIGTEICYLRGFDVGTSRMIGLIRGRKGTRVVSHPAGTEVYFLSVAALNTFTAPYMIAGNHISIKSLPRSSESEISISEVTAEELDYQGGGFRPLPCENLLTADGTNAYVTGQNISLTWSFKHATDTSAAGAGLSDASSSPMPTEGTFLLRMYSGTALKREVALTAAVYTYTNANLVADFGAEPASFIVHVHEVLNGLTSEAETATITKV